MHTHTQTYTHVAPLCSPAVAAATAAVRLPIKSLCSVLFSLCRSAGRSAQLHDLEHIEELVRDALQSRLRRRPTPVLPAGGARQQYPGAQGQSHLERAVLHGDRPRGWLAVSGLCLRVQQQGQKRADGRAGRDYQSTGETADVRLG